MSDNEKKKAIILEPQCIFNAGIVGWDANKDRYIYDYNQTLNAIIQSILNKNEDELDEYSDEFQQAEIEALDDLNYNTIGNLINMGKHAPIFKY